jgi:hypothetical protein
MRPSLGTLGLAPAGPISLSTQAALAGQRHPSQHGHMPRNPSPSCVVARFDPVPLFVSEFNFENHFKLQ